MKKASADQSLIVVYTIPIGNFLLSWGDTIQEEAQQALQQAIDETQCRGGLFRFFGDDLHLHLTAFGGDFSSEDLSVGGPAKECRKVADQVVEAIFRKAALLRHLNEEGNRLDLKAGLGQVEHSRVEMPFTERGAEPIFVAKAVHGSWGFFNRALFSLYFSPETGSGRRIEGNDSLAVVRSIRDLKKGSDEIERYEFGPGEINQLMALIADADQWQLSAVYAVKGRFGEGDLASELAARVGPAPNPVLLLRGQSGLPAIGECTQAVGEFYFGPAGADGRYRGGLLPVSQEDLGRSPFSGAVQMVAYCYQSYDNGRIPADADVIDVFDQNRPETRHLQTEASSLIGHMVSHGQFEPYLNPAAAEALAEAVMRQLGDRFQEIPDGDDPMILAANQAASFTLSDIKADSGGRVGHTLPPNLFKHVATASLAEAKNQSLILGTSQILEVGDDGHLLMTHTRGADANKIHLFAYRTFFRQVWVSEVLGYKWYGLGQDLVGEATQGKATAELANLTDEFMRLLPDFLPVPEKKRMGQLEAAYRQWKEGKGVGREPLRPFSGNVSGQGPGFAELPMPGPERVGLLAMDKTGPSAFNIPVWKGLRKSWSDGELKDYLKEEEAYGAILEIWDVKDHRRIFLDLENEGEQAAHLLAAVEDFNVKRIWTRTHKVWKPSMTVESLGRIILSASTEKLAVITGGEYRGKDDPVLLAVQPLAESLNCFMRDSFYMTQGDGRGSHFMFPTPLPMEDAVATVYSRAIAVSAWIDLDSAGQIINFQDVFALPEFDQARHRAFTLNKRIWDAQGGNFIPVGVGAAKVEPAYPLAQTLDHITAAGSKYRSDREI